MFLGTTKPFHPFTKTLVFVERRILSFYRLTDYRLLHCILLKNFFIFSFSHIIKKLALNLFSSIVKYEIMFGCVKIKMVQMITKKYTNEKYKKSFHKNES